MRRDVALFACLRRRSEVISLRLCISYAIYSGITRRCRPRSPWQRRCSRSPPRSPRRRRCTGRAGTARSNRWRGGRRPKLHDARRLGHDDARTRAHICAGDAGRSASISAVKPAFIQTAKKVWSSAPSRAAPASEGSSAPSTSAAAARARSRRRWSRARAAGVEPLDAAAARRRDELRELVAEEVGDRRRRRLGDDRPRERRRRVRLKALYELLQAEAEHEHACGEQRRRARPRPAAAGWVPPELGISERHCRQAFQRGSGGRGLPVPIAAVSMCVECTARVMRSAGRAARIGWPDGCRPASPRKPSQRRRSRPYRRSPRSRRLFRGLLMAHGPNCR